MQIIENWTEVVGEVIYIEHDKENGVYSWITFKVIKKKPFQKYPDLLANVNKELIKIRVDQSTLDRLSISKGSTLQGTVRVAKTDLYFFNQQTLKII